MRSNNPLKAAKTLRVALELEKPEVVDKLAVVEGETKVPVTFPKEWREYIKVSTRARTHLNCPDITSYTGISFRM